MKIPEDFSNYFTILESQPGASMEEIAELREFSPISLPIDYIEILQDFTEIELSVNFKNEDRYLRFWNISGCIELNEIYEIQKYVSNSLAIGDNGGGHFLLWMEGLHGVGLYIMDTGDPGVSESRWISRSIETFLKTGEGLENLYRL